MASVLSSLIELIDICKNRLLDINISPAEMVFKKSAENCNLSLQSVNHMEMPSWRMLFRRGKGR